MSNIRLLTTSIVFITLLTAAHERATTMRSRTITANAMDMMNLFWIALISSVGIPANSMPITLPSALFSG